MFFFLSFLDFFLSFLDFFLCFDDEDDEDEDREPLPLGDGGPSSNAKTGAGPARVNGVSRSSILRLLAARGLGCQVAEDLRVLDRNSECVVMAILTLYVSPRIG